MKPSCPPRRKHPSAQALLALATLSATMSPVAAQDLSVRSGDVQPPPPSNASEALERFRVKEGFTIEAVATEPLLTDPVAIAFDADSNLYVAEMRGYSERRDERLGRIRRLVDTDRDGRYDASTVFLDDLAWPTALICYGGGVFIGATPDLIFARDLDGDGRADERRVVFTGFGSEESRLNVQRLINSFRWGLDNRIHGASGGNRGLVRSVDHPDRPPVETGRFDFSFDPRTLDIRPEPGGGQHGMAFDDRGTRFVCSNSSHIEWMAFSGAWSERFRHVPAPNPRRAIAEDGPAAPVFRASPDEAWRVVRTQWRVGGLVPGPIEGGGRPSGYFTGATGICIFRGGAWPPGFQGNAFIADCGSNLVHRKIVEWDGVEPVARRPANEQRSEFLVSDDNWFRPVQLENGPDGNLLVVDMYRGVIEHPWSLPDPLKRHLDLNAGGDRGRIYRVRPSDRAVEVPPPLEHAPTETLIGMLAHPDGWTRDTASRLLVERGNPAIAAPVERFLGHTDIPLGRVHALSVLDGVGVLTPEILAGALGDPSPAVRLTGLRTLGERPDLAASGPVDIALPALIDDPDPTVRFFALLMVPEADRTKTVSSALDERLAAVLAFDPDPWIRGAALEAAARRPATVLANLLDAESNAPDAREVGAVRKLIESSVGGLPDKEPLEIARRISGLPRSEDRVGLHAALWSGMPAGLVTASPALLRLRNAAIADAVGLLEARDASEEARSDAVSLASLSPDPAIREFLLRHGINEPGPSGERALEVLFRKSDPPAEAVFEAWSRLSPGRRGRVVEWLLQTDAGRRHLLSRLGTAGELVADLSLQQRNRLREFALLEDPDGPAVRRLATGAPASEPPPALSDPGPGDIKEGGRLFGLHCAVCHRFRGEGTQVGPDLDSVASAGIASLWTAVTEPNREVAAPFLLYTVTTRDDRLHAGMIASESIRHLTLRTPGLPDLEIPLAEIERLETTGRSLMPDGFRELLGDEGLLRILHYLSAPPADRD